MVKQYLPHPLALMRCDDLEEHLTGMLSTVLAMTSITKVFQFRSGWKVLVEDDVLVQNLEYNIQKYGFDGPLHFTVCKKSTSVLMHLGVWETVPNILKRLMQTRHQVGAGVEVQRFVSDGNKASSMKKDHSYPCWGSPFWKVENHATIPFHIGEENNTNVLFYFLLGIVESTRHGLKRPWKVHRTITWPVKIWTILVVT